MGEITKEKKLNISKSKMGEREEATKKKRGSREFKPREAEVLIPLFPPLY